MSEKKILYTVQPHGEDAGSEMHDLSRPTETVEKREGMQDLDHSISLMQESPMDLS